MINVFIIIPEQDEMSVLPFLDHTVTFWRIVRSSGIDVLFGLAHIERHAELHLDWFFRIVSMWMIDQSVWIRVKVV